MSLVNKIGLLLIILYTLTLRGWTGNNSPTEITQKEAAYSAPQKILTTAFESSHERSYWVTLNAIMTRNSLELTKEEADFAYNDIGQYNEKLYSIFPPGVPLLIAPFYFIGSFFNLGQLAAYSFISICSLLSYLMLYKICRGLFKLSPIPSIIAGLTYTIATTSWSYGITLYQHIPSTLSLLIVSYSIWQYRNLQTRKPIYWNILAWLLIGLSPYIDYANVFIFIPTGIWLLYENILNLKVTSSKSSLVSALAGPILGILCFGSLMGLNWLTFGNPLQISKQLVNYHLIQQSSSEIMQSESNKPISYGLSITSIPHGLYILLFSYERGLLIYSPILILGIIGLYKFYRRLEFQTNTKVLFFALIGTFFINLLFYASFHDPWGGLSYGSRYLIPSMAILSLGVALYLNYSNKSLLFKTLWIYSAFVALLGAVTSNMLPTGDPNYVKTQGNPLPYFVNLHFIVDNSTGGFFYNTFLAQLISLKYFVLAISIIIVITITKLLDQHKSSYEN